MQRQLIFAAVSAVVCWPAWAEPVEPGNENLKEMVAGKTVHLDTPFGVAIPITYHANGLMSGKAGVLEYFLGAQVDRGRWWVSDGKLCQKWFKWLDAKPSCMRLRRDGDKVTWRRDDGLSGTATIASGLAPGAEAAPRGVGGPRQAPEPAHSLAADQPAVEAAAARATSVSAAPRRVTKSAAVGTASHGLGAGRPAAPSHADKENREALAEPSRPGMGERWCHAARPDQAFSDAIPELVRIARLASGGAEPPSEPYACLAAEPPLKNLARAGIDLP